MNARRRLLAATLAALSLPAFAGMQEARGSGRIASERRSLAGFDRIAVAGAFEIELRQGSSEGLELSGDDNLLALVETRLEGRNGSTLQISPRRDVDLRPSQPIRIRIDLIRLAGVDLAGGSTLKANGLRTARLALAIGGSGDIAISGLEAERLAVDVGGSGKVAVDGRSAEASLSIAGSGRVVLPALAADDVSISIAGSGSAEVRAERRLKISIAGSGRVRHSGAAVPTVSIVGSGDVRRV
ncbi:MAG: DUF2807 domain-containing protein [Burkholderiales bacterium]|nr:DUF2807 domain-containing protein [Burkholderiales bacterium]